MEETRSEDPLGETLATGMARVSAAELPRGSLVGRYVVLARLGAGGMGVVYAAYDPELDRKVALKLLLGGAGDSEEARVRLQREAQALARLSHPNVVAVHDVGARAGQVYLAMELIEGVTLRTWTSGHVRGWPEVVAVIEDAARGVAAAHAAGLLHRDLKPENIMIGEGGRVRVMDFGLARWDSQAPAPAHPAGPESVSQGALSTEITRHGSLIGTPAYMAPEQFLGEPVDARTDVFSLCVTLWEALYGERPFTGAGIAGLIEAVTKGERQPPPRGSKVPGWLRRVCERGLHPRPELRWGSMQELLAALHRGRGRRRLRTMAGVALVLSLGAGSALGLRAAQRGRIAAGCAAAGAEIATVWDEAARGRLRAALAEEGPGYAAATADKVTPWLDGQATAWAAAQTATCRAAELDRSWSPELALRSRWCLDERRIELAAVVAELSRGGEAAALRAVQAAASLAPIEPCRDGRALARRPIPPIEERGAVRATRAELGRADALARAGKYGEGLEVAEAALAHASALGWAPLVAEARLRRGALLTAVGRYAEGESALEGAFFAASAAGAVEVASDAATALTSVVGVSLGRPQEGLRWARHAELALQELGETEGLRAARQRLQVGIVQRRLAHDATARGLFEEVLAIRERILGSQHPEVAEVVDRLADLEESQGSLATARALCERALAVRRATLGADHPSVGESLADLGDLVMESGALDEAQALFEQALAVRERALGTSHPDYARTLTDLGDLYTARGEYTEAEALFRQALAIGERGLGADRLALSPMYNGLAIVLSQVGRLDEADASYAKALAEVERALGPLHPDAAMTLNNMANNAVARGQVDRGRDLYGRALAILRRIYGGEHPSVGITLSNLGELEVLHGRVAEGRPKLERGLQILEASLGADHVVLGFPLVALARAALAEERPGEALALAERAVGLRTRGEAPADERAVAEFVLAMALWDKGERARAFALANGARGVLAGLGPGPARQVAEIEGWLAKRAKTRDR